MSLFANFFYRLFLAAGLMATVILSAQSQARPTRQVLPADSTKVYNYVERMPVYPGGGGIKALTADLLREFRAASAAAGCAVPASPLYVNLTVGPSGIAYDVMSVNNLPLISAAEAKAGVKGIVAAKRPLPEIPAACEAALVAAARKLPRFKPGSQNGRRVAVSLLLPLIPRSR